MLAHCSYTSVAVARAVSLRLGTGCTARTSISGLDRRSANTGALGDEAPSASPGLDSVSWANHLWAYSATCAVTEAAEAVAGEPAVIQPCLVVADDTGGDEHRGERVLGAETLDPGGHVGAAGRVEQFVQAVEDHHGPAGQQQQVHQAWRSRALVEGLQGVLDVADDRTLRRVLGGVIPQRDEERDPALRDRCAKWCISTFAAVVLPPPGSPSKTDRSSPLGQVIHVERRPVSSGVEPLLRSAENLL